MSKQKTKKILKLKITRDSGANLKVLKKLEKKGHIQIFDVLGENETKKVKSKTKPVGVWGHCSWNDGSVWGADNGDYSEVREIVGKENIQDARKLEAHIRYSHDYFVTEDSDFLSKKDEIQRSFNVVVISPEELKEICQK